MNTTNQTIFRLCWFLSIFIFLEFIGATSAPTPSPSAKPTANPTYSPTKKPTTLPTYKPTSVPTLPPTSRPSTNPYNIRRNIESNVTTIASTGYANAVAVDPSGTYVYYVEQTSSYAFRRLTIATGALVGVSSSMSSAMYGVACDLKNGLYLSTFSQIFFIGSANTSTSTSSISLTAGNLTGSTEAVGAGLSSRFQGAYFIVMDPLAKYLYFTDYNNGNIKRMSTATNVTEIFAILQYPNGIAVDSNYVYALRGVWNSYIYIASLSSTLPISSFTILGKCGFFCLPFFVLLNR